MKKYRVIQDLQGGTFGMGRDYTALEWLECMLDWRDADDSWGDFGDGDNEYLDTREGCEQFWKNIIEMGEEQKLIDYIADVWSLDIQELDLEEYMDKRHLEQLLSWLKNNIDVSSGMPLIFDKDDPLQIEIEKRLGE